MYVEKRKSKKGITCFLAHSFREGGKIHKIRKLLGTNISKEVLEERISKAEKLITDEIEKYRVIKDPLDKELTTSRVLCSCPSVMLFKRGSIKV